MGTDRLTSCCLDYGTGHAAGTCSTQMVFYQHLQIFGTAGRIEIPIPFNAPPDRPTRVIVDTGADLFGGGISHLDSRSVTSNDPGDRSKPSRQHRRAVALRRQKNMACIDAISRRAPGAGRQ
jgi:hypothetical protein